MRWLIIAIIFLVSAVSYLDRTNISIAAQPVRAEFGLSQVQLGTILTAFMLGYALTQPFAGRLADRFGGYRVIAGGIVWWSALTALTACVASGTAYAFALLILMRALLGIGESVIYPASNRLVANWIPVHERGLANGIIFAGVGFGAGVAPPLVTFVMLVHGWRASFWISAAVGLAVLALWIWFARERAGDHRWVGARELDLIEKNIAGGKPVSDPPEALLRWRAIASNRNIRLLTISYFCFGYTAFIFFTWFFTYLSTVKGLDLKSSGLYAMLPFIAMAIACAFGGWMSDRITFRHGKRIGRCWPAAAGMGLAAMFVALATQVADARLAALVLAFGSGSLYLSQSAFWTLSADLGRSSAGSVSGFMNLGCQLGGAAVAQITPIVAGHYGWTASFLVTSVASVIGAVCWLLIDPKAELHGVRSASIVAQPPLVADVRKTP
ncbi:MFS transporter [Sphingomonas crusticola]|uniref:MFS transporter n=1 Tax=Sphingomonas crusticola TaxID=1697973 RepID=UPI0013C33A19|nr:MFS transporter [Sphingomonas crusticola]